MLTLNLVYISVTLIKIIFMQPVQFETTISSLTEIKIPDELKDKIQLNQEVHVLLIPAGERLYEDWEDDEWNKLSLMLNDGE